MVPMDLRTYLGRPLVPIVGRAAQPSILDKRFRNVILEFNFFILHHAISNNLWTKVMSSNNWAFLLSHTILLPSVFCWRWCGCGCLAISLIIWLYKDGVVSSQTQMLVYCFYFCAICIYTSLTIYHRHYTNLHPHAASTFCEFTAFFISA